MNVEAATLPDPATAPLAQFYRVAVLVSIMTLGLALAERASGIWPLLVPMVALTGAFLRWPQAPVFTLFTTFLAMLASQRLSRPTLINDVIVCASTLVFTIGHYRFLGLVDAAVPNDPRRKLARPGVLPGFFRFRTRSVGLPLRRDPAKASPEEIPRIVMLVVSSVVVSATLWWLLPAGSGPFGIRPGLWRVGLMAIMLFGTGLFIAAVLTVWRWKQWSAEEAEMVVRNGIWQETRGEQRLIARWAAEGNLRRSVK